MSLIDGKYACILFVRILDASLQQQQQQQNKNNNNINNTKIYETSLSAVLLSSGTWCHITDNLHVYRLEIFQSL